MSTFDRLDILAAHWMFCSLYHGGQGSHEYSRLSSIQTRFTPSPLWRQPRHLPANARSIFRDLVVKHHGIHSTTPQT